MARPVTAWLPVFFLASAASVASQTQFSVAMPRPSPFGPGIVGLGAAAGDLDGDGDADFVFATQNGTRLFVREVSGYRDASTALPIGSGNHGDVHLFDADGDGDLDVLLLARPSTSGMGTSALLRNDGDLRFTAQPTALPPLTTAVASAVADLDRDGDVDVVVATGLVGAAGLIVLDNDGAGTFTVLRPTGLVTPERPIVRLAIADFDGDRDPDVLVGGVQQLGWLANLGGSFAYRAISTATTEFMVADDLNGDGFPEVASYADGPLHVVLYEGTPTGPRSTATVLAEAVSQISLLAFVDVDADGRRDVVFAEPATGAVTQVLRNEGSLRFAPMPGGTLPLQSDSASALLEVDLDGNGTRDLVQLSRATATGADVTVLLRTAGGWHDASSAAFGGAPPGAAGPRFGLPGGITVVDIDHDGDPDLSLGNRIARNDGAGKFTLGHGRGARLAPVYVDLDGDGDLDRIQSRDGVIRELLVYRNDGGGSDTLVYTLNHGVIRLVVADFDLDGRMDLHALTDMSRHIHLRGAPAPTWFVDASSSFPTIRFEESGDVATIDVDRDGDLDLVLANSQLVTQLPRSRLLRNDGGTFVDVTATALPPSTLRESTTFAITGDFDGDGTVDLLFTSPNLYGTPTKIMRGRGDGTFHPWLILPQMTIHWTNGVVAADFDEDGRLDLLWTRDVATPPLAAVGMVRGIGAAGFADAQSRISLPVPTSFGGGQPVAVDVDGDLDLDVVTFLAPSIERTETAPVVLINHHRQLTASERPRLGTRWSARIHVKPGYGTVPSVAVPILGVAAASIPLLPLGTLRVDPTSGAILPSLFVPALPGHADVSIELPVDRSLVGVSLHAQALIVDLVAGAKFTNALVERIW